MKVSATITVEFANELTDDEIMKLAQAVSGFMSDLEKRIERQNLKPVSLDITDVKKEK